MFRLPVSRLVTRRLQASVKAVRWISADGGKIPKVDFQEVLEVSQSSNPDKTRIIDVREPEEYARGTIPGAINVPLKSFPQAYLLDDGEFEQLSGSKIPANGCIMFCKAGVRSRMAATMASQSPAWNDVHDYSGSWDDWVKNNGPVVIPDRASPPQEE